MSAVELTTLIIVMLVVVGVVHTGIAYALYFGSMNGLKAQTVALFMASFTTKTSVQSTLVQKMPTSGTKCAAPNMCKATPVTHSGRLQKT